MLTLAQAEAELKDFIPEGDDPAERRRWINAVCRVLIAREDWPDTWQRIRLTAHNGIITLPREYGAMRAFISGDRCGLPGTVWNHWYSFHANGPGDESYCTSDASDLGTGYAVFRELEDAFTLRAQSEDTRGLVGLVGESITGEKVIDTLNLSNQVASVVSFGQIIRVLKPVTQSQVDLYAVRGGDETLIGSYAPGELVPSYRRYRVNKTYEHVVAIVKRRYVEAVSANDLVYPSNTEALRRALQARTYEVRNDLERAAFFWSAAIEALRDEAEDFSTGTHGRLQIEDDFQMSTIGGRI